MNFSDISVGTDIENISRFKDKTPGKDDKFLLRIFTQKELDYCYSHGIPEQHLCARYCAKEAVVKALSEYGITDVYYSDIEIYNAKNGKPNAKILKYPDVMIKLSLSHTKDLAVCTSICYRENN